MSDTNNQYLKFMSDIIDSGLWGKLSPAAKTLYPVLLKFSDQNFKHVWPGTDTLLKLTGFKTKKSILAGKKELIKEGLLHYRPGSGRTNSTYYFSFNYPGSKITPLWGKGISPASGQEYLSADTPRNPLSNPVVYPNNLNITINNNQSTDLNKSKDSIGKLIKTYGISIVENAIEIAKSKGLEENISYLSGICRNLSTNLSQNVQNFNQHTDHAQHIIDSWQSFLDWSQSHLTRTSVEILRSISIDVDGQAIFIKHRMNEFLRQIILKYFNEEISPPILIVFSEIPDKSYQT